MGDYVNYILCKGAQFSLRRHADNTKSRTNEPDRSVRYRVAVIMLTNSSQASHLGVSRN